MQVKLCDGDSPSLPADKVFDLVARLPAKDLCRFRSVSKGWRALISDLAFVAAQRSHAGPVIVAMFGSEQEQQLRLLDKDDNVLMVFDVKGSATLALTQMDLILVDMAHLGAMIIHSASGRDFTVFGMKDPPWPRWSAVFFMNDYSFGHATPSGDYKVLRLHETSSEEGRRKWCEVATIMDGGGAESLWRRRPWGPLNRTHFFCEYKATTSGILYFMADIDFVSLDRTCIAAFDHESEKWKAETIKAPLLGIKKHEDNWYFCLTELKATLCFVHNLENLHGCYANIWLLKDPNRSIWVKEYTIRMPQRLLSTKPLDVLGDGTLLLLLNRLERARKNDNYNRYILQFYNPSTSAFTEIMEMAEGFNGRMAFYTGSLLS